MLVSEFDAQFATEVSESIANQPDAATDSPTLLATLVRDKFAATTLLRLVVANVSEEARQGALFHHIRIAATALAGGNVAAYAAALATIRSVVGRHGEPNDLVKVALDALEMVPGVADGTQPPLF